MVEIAEHNGTHSDVRDRQAVHDDDRGEDDERGNPTVGQLNWVLTVEAMNTTTATIA